MEKPDLESDLEKGVEKEPKREISETQDYTGSTGDIGKPGYDKKGYNSDERDYQKNYNE